MRFVPALMHPHSKVAVQPCRALGVRSVDVALGGGLARGRVHEIYAAEADDMGSTTGFAVAVAARLTHPGQSLLWLRTERAALSGGVIQANGWAELGGIPGDALVGVLPDGMALLRDAVDALRCPALGVVIVESWGGMRELDLTASRRLALAAEKSGVPLLLLRIEAAPAPSAAQTRWQVASAPSRALPGHAPGMPAFDVTLLRQRSGPCGLGWRLEWDRDQRIFREAALSGAVVPVPADRPVGAGGGGPVIPPGRYAA